MSHSFFCSKVSVLFLIILQLSVGTVAAQIKDQSRKRTAPKATKLITTKNAQKKSSQSNKFHNIDIAIQNKDFLGARILLKKVAKTNLNYSEWIRGRNLLIKYPSLGFDLLFKWGKLLPESTSSKIVAANERIDEQIEKADQLMLKENFKESFVIYQRVAKLLKNEITKNKKENYFLYQTVVHYMARALYGAGRFKDSLKVYGWINKDYFRYKQVLFEKMWAAFRAERLDLALGSIASQHSSYFSEVIEPETFLIQIYVFKKLCRDEDIEKVMANINEQKKRVADQTNKDFFEDWTKSDIEYISLYKLAMVGANLNYEGNRVGDQERKKEQGLIEKSLHSKFEAERKRISDQLDTVKAFSLLSSAISKIKVNLDVVPNRSKLMASGKEFWPVDDAEDWIDELGEHLYIGESQCEDRAQK